ncbi:uncharacterized protein C8Q71DRAFT_774035 [Rhodofomes roseus]|uniref:F-box domain-containing protein n=1 Tax=Rhodofomes roseus TaxID=34475 RepID=A0ABQ8K8R0_9APHY|nr:uncharacterized protein C8Q71DRAFT_774035 [Rhodofomes roseus]KAH9833570.1 hypothetical protein C8Q71DRAFT_774035 [Rhodofomes roseus]
MVVGFQSLNDDVLALVIALISRRDMKNLALTSRTVSPVARRRLLSSLRLKAPVNNLEFHNYVLEEDDRQRIQYLHKLTILCSLSPWYHEPESADVYSPLATVLVRARNLWALVVSELEGQLATEGGGVLGDAIASVRGLRELELDCVATRGMALCERLTCKPSVVRLQALSLHSIPNPRAEVQPATLAGLEILRNASAITLHNFQLICDEEEEVPLPQPHAYRWNRARSLSLKNMDPVALAPLCPNLGYLQVAFWQADDDGSGTTYGDDYHYTRTAEFTDDVHVACHLRVLDIYNKVNWNCEKSQIYDTITLTVRMTLPVVLSMQFHYGDTTLWTELATLSKHADARLRYLDVLMHDDVSGDSDAQVWLDQCLPLFSDSDLLCIRLRLVDQIDRVIDAEEFESMVDDEDELVSDHWEDIQNEAPQVIAKAIPSLRYVAVSSGYMVENDAAPGGSSFRGQAQWWRVVGDEEGSGVAGSDQGSRSVEVDEEDSEDAESGEGEGLIEIDEEEGERIDEYLRSEAFAKTLKL